MAKIGIYRAFSGGPLSTTVYIGDTANANMTLGLTINQGAADNEILALKSSDVTHTVTTDTEADTYALIKKYSATAGGALLRGLTDSDASGALVLEGIIGATNPTDTNSALILIGSKQSGTTTAALGAAETVMQIYNRTTALLTILGSGHFLIGDTSNAGMTQGLTINQGASDDEILALKSSDVAHTVTTDTEADNYGYIKKYSATAGGVLFRGLTDTDAEGALVLEGIIGSTNPTDIRGALLLIGSKQTGNTTVALGAAETVAKIYNRTTELFSMLGDGKVNFWVTANDGTNYEGLQINPATGSMAIAAITAGTGADNIDVVLTSAGTGLVKPRNLGVAVVTKVNTDSPYTVLSTDYTVLCNATSGAITVNLPAATGTGRILEVKKTDSSINAITVDGNSNDTIDGATTQTLGVQYEAITIQDTASTAWSIL